MNEAISHSTITEIEGGTRVPPGSVLRYSFHERLVHWLSGFSYLYLMLTGLAFWSPWLYWLAFALGGTTISRELHPWVGLVFVVAVLLMFRMWHRQMHETAVDKEWWDAIPHYIRNEDELVPTVGRFNGGQKLLFWGFLWCGIFLLLSGLILWFPHWVPWDLRFLRYIAVIVHPSLALITIGLFIIHVYMGVAMERGALLSMTRGYVTIVFAKRYHGLWYDRVAEDPSAKNEAP
jgi:formate dehydrogenase subunit gamma